MFQGFDDTTVDFMWGIRFNNDRTWFAEHKQEYLDHFQTPMRELQREVYDHIAPQLEDYGLIGKTSRIYRDARRLFGRGPYKDHLWLSVERPKEETRETPCFWFELAPEGWSYGMGFWQATPMTMARLRARVRRDRVGREEVILVQSIRGILRGLLLATAAGGDAQQVQAGADDDQAGSS